jgi:hypothetical protein
MAADITADHLAKRLEASGYVVMKKPPAPHTVNQYMPRFPLKGLRRSSEAFVKCPAC